MSSFKDNTGRAWTVEVTVATVKRVRKLAEVNLLEVLDGKLIDRLIADPVLLVDVLYVVCKPEADVAGVSDEDFGRAMAGDAVEAATKALLEAIVSFCPSPRDREHLGLVLKAVETAQEEARDVVAQRLKGPDLRRVIDLAVGQATARSD